jgi:tetratricopeptide (TPR) repeat protein
MRNRSQELGTGSRKRSAIARLAMRSIWLLAPGFWLLPLTGCETPEKVRRANVGVSAFLAGEFDAAGDRLRPLADQTDENFVLNNCRLGSAALARYDLEEAEAAFLKAYEVMNSVGVNDGGRSLGAALVDEKIRIWKGEPFERAMTSFYLGMVYYMRQDYGNARGAFENALFKLRDASDKRDEKDDYRRLEQQFPLAAVMLGRCWQKLDRPELAEANFARVRDLRPDLGYLADPSRHAEANVVLVIDFGRGPQKVTDFDGSILGFAPKPREVGDVPPPALYVDGQRYDVADMTDPPVDLLALAQDRRWQSIDTIRLTKSTIGTGLIAGGAGYGVYRAGSRDGMRGEDAAVAAGLIATGLLLKATSQADVRQWEMLPRTTFVLPLKLPPGEHEIAVDFPDARGLRQTWRGLVAPESGDATYYFRVQRFNSGPFDWPPPTMAGVQ